MSAAPVLKAPFPYFGGKSRVADLVWSRLGDVSNFVEPFFGSGAVLLRRPHPPKIETINDVNQYVANFWRATKQDPEAVATHADWPVNEADLHARHRWLVLSRESTEFRERMRTDPDYYDAKIAGWWAWGQCCWIGSGWCDVGAEWNGRPYLGCQEGQYGLGVNAKGPHDKMPTMERCQTGGKGVNGVGEKRPLLGGRSERDNGHGVHRAPSGGVKRPKLSGGSPDSGALGAGVHANGHRPQLADAYARGRGVHGNDDAGTCEQRRAWLLDWFDRLSDRLRVVRVCCGDWLRVCDSESVTTRLGLTGVFLDPPYPTHAADGTESRSASLYSGDDRDDLDTLRDRVLAWCKERGPNPLMRIAVCGYDTDGYAALETLGWDVVAWKAQGGYGNRSAKGKENAGRERIWFSPHCLKPGEKLLRGPGLGLLGGEEPS